MEPQKIHVLCVDDSPYDRELIRRALEKGEEGFTITEASDRQTFESRLAAVECDVVLTDFNILGFEGLEVIKIVQERLPGTPVIVITGTGSEEIAVKALKQGAADYVIKTPSHIAQLPLTIRRVLGARRSETERERLLSAIEQSGEAVLITDSEGTIQYVNPAFERTTGYEADEAVGQNPSFLKSGKQNEAFYREMWETISSGRTWQGRIINRKKDGSHYTESATLSPVLNPAGKIINYVSIKRDITEHLRLEAQLQQSQRMETIGRLAGGVAHDFNNILSIILGYAQMALDEVSPGHRLHDPIAEILEAGRRASDLTRQLLAFSRQQTLQPEVLDINAVVKNVERMLRRLIGEDIELVTDLADDPGYVKADASQIEQIIINLAVNARDAMPEGGRLAVATARADLDVRDGPGQETYRSGSDVMISVSDTGGGMDEETRSKIFEPFFTTKEKSKGTGLGLSTVYGIVKQSDGHVSCSSEPGQGTTFNIYLPRTEEKPAQKPVSPDGIEQRTGGEEILLVEDEPALRGLLDRFLKGLNYTVSSAANAGEALLLVEEKGLRPDLVISDVVMPGMSGRVLVERLLRIQPDLKVIYMSGYTDDAIVHHGVLDPDTPFIHKPFSLNDFRSMVDHVLSGR